MLCEFTISDFGDVRSEANEDADGMIWWFRVIGRIMRRRWDCKLALDVGVVGGGRISGVPTNLSTGLSKRYND